MDFERVFDESYERVLKRQLDGETFFQAFYRRFTASDPGVAVLFHHTDMQRQQQLLEKSFYRLVVFYATNYADDYLEKIAQRHSKRELNIAPHYYDLWLDCLIDTLADFDPLFDANIELSWRLVLSTGITYMKFKYDH
ncbi:globin [Motiliproteus sp. SC1-56]|uniref:globin n=1 Tax=Motiliproteus sp. SC1-56 TaxID=2799565 RepID=UPI001A8E92F4|nr:globin [Motiliproteus sp. SC1-56]